MHEVLRTSSPFTLVSGSKGMGFTASGTMGPRFNEVPWDWEIGCKIESLDLTNLRKNNLNVRYIEGWLIDFNIIVLYYFFVA